MEMQSKNNQAALNEAKHHRFLNLICWEDGANLGTNLNTKKKQKTKQPGLLWTLLHCYFGWHLHSTQHDETWQNNTKQDI